MLLWKSSKRYIERRINQIKRKSKRKKLIVNIPDNYWAILDQYATIVSDHDYILEFSTRSGMSRRGLNAYAGASSGKQSIIAATPEWAVQLIACNNIETDNAFRITLGHELTHKDPEVWLKGRLLDCKLLLHLRELHADFGAAKKMASCNRNVLIHACEYKKRFKEMVCRKKDRDGLFHPSWTRRIEYATHYDFDDRLIKKVAADLRYSEDNPNHKKLIEQIIEEYKDKFVILQPPPTPITEGDTD